MEFEWDAAKAAANLKKHRVSFEEAASVFGDALALTFADPDHSADEERWLTFGLSHTGRLLVVSHAERSGRVRIISAREATKHELKIYQEG
ncbi:MAG: BrnT family toxin [Gammaproteobacteria bacterium]|nr:BrnT family toxin [Gammaproteobacteria bacterium]